MPHMIVIFFLCFHIVESLRFNKANCLCLMIIFFKSSVVDPTYKSLTFSSLHTILYTIQLIGIIYICNMSLNPLKFEFKIGL